MTDQEISRILAESDQVMGWEGERVTGGLYPGWYWTDPQDNYELVMKFDDFDPPNNIKQAMWCRDKMIENGYSFSMFATCSVSSAGHGDTVYFTKSIYPYWGTSKDVNIYIGAADTPARAICMAILRVIEKQ